MPRNYKQMKTAAEKRKRVLELREQGATFQEIADLVYPGKDGAPGSRSNAHKAFTQAIKDIPLEKAEEARTLENNRLDRLWLVQFSVAMSAEATRDDKLKAARMCISIMERRAKLNGLDAPAQVHNIGDGIVNITFDNLLTPEPMLEAVVIVDDVAD